MATRMYVCESVEHPSSLLMGLNEQRLQGLLCDVTVRVQGHLFKAHTNILASAMGYFRDLFLNPNKQIKKDIIEIPMIVNSIGFAKVLDFIYTSQLCLSQSSVMQVLCSACYLQIPYVVDKCQEFIVTHGHASPQNSFPAINDQRYSQNKSTDNQECELINTPPSPGNYSTSTGNRDEQNGVTGSPLEGVENNVSSPTEPLGKQDMVMIKQEESIENAENYQAGDEGVPNPASRALIEFSNQSKLTGASIGSLKMGSLKMLLQNSEGGPQDVDAIDHESLAEYFARNNAAMTNGELAGSLTHSSASFLLGNRSQSPSTSVEHHLYSMSKNMRTSPSKEIMNSSPTSSVSQYLLSMKKEKPKKEYRCDYCNKLFGRQQHLKRHILTHTGERPYPCSQCEKRFRRSEHLKHHLVKHQQQDAVPGEGYQDYTGTGKKRSRKPVPTDAYGMSKMMLISYNQPRMNLQDDSPTSDAKKREMDPLTSNPLLLNKLSLNNISDRLALAASQNYNSTELESMKEKNDQNSTNHSDAYSPVALNLTNKDMSSSAYTKTKIVELENDKEISEGNEKPMERDQQPVNGTSAESPQNNNVLEMFDNNDTSANIEEGAGNAGVEDDMTNSEDSKQSPFPNVQNNTNNVAIDGFESSEVVTNDLKRLFAAMDE